MFCLHFCVLLPHLRVLMQVLDDMDREEEEQREKRIQEGKNGGSKPPTKRNKKAAVKKEKSHTQGICYSSTAESSLWHSCGNNLLCLNSEPILRL